jgi:hypothetical protein
MAESTPRVLSSSAASFLGLEASETLLEADGYGQDGVTGCILLDPFHDLAEMLVLLSDVVLLAQVDEVDNRLGGEEEERVDELDLETFVSNWCLRYSSKQKCNL